MTAPEPVSGGRVGPAASDSPDGRFSPHCRSLEKEFRERPAHSVAEAADRILKLTQVSLQPTQVRMLLRSLGLRWRQIGTIPAPPKLTGEEYVQRQTEFLEQKREPKLAEARAVRGHVFFADAAHLVLGSFLCCLWCIERTFVRASSGRQRFNVLGDLECVLTRTGVDRQHNRRQSTNVPRTIVKDRGSETDRPDDCGSRQCVLPTLRRLPRHRTVAPAVVLARSEPDRTTLEVHQERVPLRPALRQLCRLPSPNRNLPVEVDPINRTTGSRFLDGVSEVDGERLGRRAGVADVSLISSTVGSEAERLLARCVATSRGSCQI